MRKNPHVRICGGPGSATTLVYPTVAKRDGIGFVGHVPQIGDHPAHLGPCSVAARERPNYRLRALPTFSHKAFETRTVSQRVERYPLGPFS